MDVAHLSLDEQGRLVVDIPTMREQLEELVRAEATEAEAPRPSSDAVSDSASRASERPPQLNIICFRF